MISPSTPHPIQTSETVRETISQDGAILLDIKQGICFSMNPVGARIFTMLKDGSTVEQIASALESEFHVSRTQIEADLAEFLEDLKTRNLIRFEGGSNPRRRSWFSRLFL